MNRYVQAIVPAGGRIVTAADDAPGVSVHREIARRERAAGLSKPKERPMKKLTVGAALAATTVLGAIGVASASSNNGDGPAGKPNVLHLATRTTQEAQINAPDSLLGLRFVGADDVFKGSQLVGHEGRSCEAVEEFAGSARFQCIVTLALQGGIITAQALPTFTENGLEDFQAAITGGTNAYRHARGTVTVDRVSQTESRLTIDLR
jgi:hypothetical protein